jgi:hypothetical protein
MKTNKLSTLAIVFASISLLFFPIVFGPAALILAIIGLVNKEPRGVLALVLSIAFPIIGMVLGAMYVTNMIN